MKTNGETTARGKRRERHIGVLGGTFDPVHEGHVALALAALEREDIDEVWFLPNPIPPHKALAEDTAGVEARLAMLRLAAMAHPDLHVSELEIHSGKENYTYQTLAMLDERFPDDRFFFIIGADSLFLIESWKCPEKLLPGHYFLASCRDDYDDREVKEKLEEINEKYGSHIALLPMMPVDVSSTQIRACRKTGQDISGLVPESVREYIEAHGLYEECYAAGRN